MEKYKANFDDDVRLLDRFGRIDTRTGEYARIIVEDAMVHYLDTLQKSEIVKDHR